jgi:hypothetical protein
VLEIKEEAVLEFGQKSLELAKPDTPPPLVPSFFALDINK